MGAAGGAVPHVARGCDRAEVPRVLRLGQARGEAVRDQRVPALGGESEDLQEKCVTTITEKVAVVAHPLGEMCMSCAGSRQLTGNKNTEECGVPCATNVQLATSAWSPRVRKGPRGCKNVQVMCKSCSDFGRLQQSCSCKSAESLRVAAIAAIAAQTPPPHIKIRVEAPGGALSLLHI